MADGVSLFYTTPQADDTQLPAPMCAPFPICTSIPFSTVGTFDSTAAPVRNPFPFLPQAKYARVRPHRHSDRPQLGKGGATLLLPRKSVGRDMGARPVIRRRDRLRRRFRQAGKVRDPRTGPGPQSTRLLPEPLYTLLTPRSRPRSHVSKTRLPNKRSSRRERADRNMRGIFRIPADASAAAAASSSSFVLPTVERALVKMEGDLGCCLYDSCCKCRSGCERKDAGDEAEDVEWECWGGVGVGFADGS